MGSPILQTWSPGKLETGRRVCVLLEGCVWGSHVLRACGYDVVKVIRFYAICQRRSFCFLYLKEGCQHCLRHQLHKIWICLYVCGMFLAKPTSKWKVDKLSGDQMTSSTAGQGLTTAQFLHFSLLFGSTWVCYCCCCFGCMWGWGEGKNYFHCPYSGCIRATSCNLNIQLTGLYSMGELGFESSLLVTKSGPFLLADT